MVKDPSAELIRAANGAVQGEGVVFPADSGVLNVKAFGAKGDGVTDDTAAIQAAYQRTGLIYLPNGKYLVTGQIKAPERKGSASARRIIQGQSRDGVVIKLQDGAIIRLADKTAGYTDPAKPKWVVATGSEGDKRDNHRGGGNRAFRHMIRNLTIDVGAGNPGAVALDFIANNRGAVDRVTLIGRNGSGHTGLDLTRWWPGPAMIIDVKIEGFERGIAMDHYQYGMTFERIHLTGQRTVGISNTNNVAAMRRVRFEGNVPFYEAKGGHSMITLLDSELIATSPVPAALITPGIVNLRRVAVSGFKDVIRNTGKNGTSLPASASGNTTIASYDQGLVKAISPSAKPLDLPIEEIPEIIPPANAKWVDGGTTSATLQAAIDSGAEWIFLNPLNPVELSETVILRNNVRLIQGLSAHMKGPKDGPGIRVENGNVPVVVLDNIYLDKGAVQNSNRTFVFRHGDLERHGVKGTGRGGKTHIIDVIGRGYDIGAGHKLYARQLNSEFGEEPLFTNSGGDSWLLGFKMETSPRGSKDAPNSTPSLLNKSGNLEVFAGLLYTLGGKAEQAPLVPAFTNERGRLTVSFRNNGIPATFYKNLLRTGSFANGKDHTVKEVMGSAPGMALLIDQR